MNINFKIEGFTLKPGPKAWFIKEDEADAETTLTETIERAHQSSSYLDFAGVLKDIQFKSAPRSVYTLFIKNHKLYTFRNKYNRDNTFLKAWLFDVYTFESPEVEAIVKDLFTAGRTAWTNGVRFQLAATNPVLGINECVFRLVVACKLLDSSNTPVYHNFEKTFPNGKVRVLSEPHETIKGTLKDLNEILYSAYGEKNRGVQCAYKKGLSILDNAAPHAVHRYVYKGDISNFFPSCKRELVKKYSQFIFENSIKGNQLLEYFLDKMLIDDGLCLGNPISATLANAIVAAPAAYINNMCKKVGITFTQYSDDVTFSSDRPISREWVIKVFYEAYKKYNLEGYFELKPSKLVGQVGQQRNVTGIAFDHTTGGTPTIRGYMYRTMRVAIHKYSLGETLTEAQIRKVRGQIAFSIMVGRGQRTLRYLNKFGEDVKRVFISERLEEKILASVEGEPITVAENDIAVVA